MARNLEPRKFMGDTYVGTVKSMRENGIEIVIMIDASRYGQETGPIIKDAKRVLQIKMLFFHIMFILL